MSKEEEICVICCCKINFYAIGACDHPVCLECSTRMRVLCQQNECPICRTDMPLVYFSTKKQDFPVGKKKFPLFSNEYTIAFEDRKVENAFKTLLQHKCSFCSELYDRFTDLEKHVRRHHTQFYCELCVEHLKIFTYERKCYSRTDLALHRRVGDKDNTSHRGHPLCEFCDKRFLDPDELYRHLRREHYFCHFCDADGTLNGQFYDDYPQLKVHFRAFHYLCEEDECASEKFVSAFRTEIDFRAHKALNHNKNKTKTELKQQRMLNFGFQITPRNAASSDSSPKLDPRSRYKNMSKNNMDDDLSSRNSNDVLQNDKEVQKVTFNTHCNQDFPHLNNDTVNRSNQFNNIDSNKYSKSVSTSNNFNILRTNKTQNSNQGVEDFPALSSSASSSQVKNDIHTWRKPHTFHENKITKPKSNSDWNTSTTKIMNIEEEFPKLNIKDTLPTKPVVQQGAWCKPDNIINQVADLSQVDQENLAQQLNWKMKSKKKKKKRCDDLVENTNTSSHDDKIEPPALDKLYMGLSNTKNVFDSKLKNKLEQFTADGGWDECDSWHTPVSFGELDFPPLKPSPVAATTSRCPPGFEQPKSSVPPGFSNLFKANNSIPKLKNVSLTSIAQQLTNNNTSEECQSIPFIFVPPYDFEKRNVLLFDRILELVSDDNKSFDEFKLLSRNFRKGLLAAHDYYLNCQKILGEDRFLQLFMELVCLLPDIKKQQELLAVHNGFVDNLKKKGAVPKGVHFPSTSLTVCQTCMQVLLGNDLNDHMKYHKDTYVSK